MSQNLFWPIYKQIEKEFKEISYYIAFDRKQLETYSVKIADLILRTVSECENVASALCKKENIEFKDRKGNLRNIVYFHEYIKKLNSKFNLKNKLVRFDFQNASENIFDMKRAPFEKETKQINGKEKFIWSWYYSYNMIKHDRINNFKEANLKNLINGLAALFLLNIYYLDEVYYLKKSYNIKKIIKKIKNFSDVFSVDIEGDGFGEYNGNTFFDPYTYFEIAKEHSTYIIEYDKEIKTDSDKGAEFLDKLESKIFIKKSDGSFKKKHENYEFENRKTKCPIIGRINRKG